MNTKYLIIVTSIFLVGCGGGSSSPTPTSNPNTGVFLDSNVEGLEYSTDTLSGTTNANGEFQYNDGELITFSLYGQTLSVVPGFGVLTPFDNLDGTVHEDYAINVLRLLQTLDTDGDANNGIVLPSVAGTMNLNFNQSIADFAIDTDVVAFVSANSNIALVTAEFAIDHFSTTLTGATANYTLDVTNRTAISVGTSSTCTNDAQGGFDWTFTSSDLTIVGSDTFITTATSRDCTLGPSDTETILWTDLTSDSSFSLFCGPVCTYNELNRVSYGIDIDGRYHITSIWHVPDSNVITEIKRVYTGPFIDFWGIPYTSHKEVITLQ